MRCDCETRGLLSHCGTSEDRGDNGVHGYSCVACDFDDARANPATGNTLVAVLDQVVGDLFGLGWRVGPAGKRHGEGLVATGGDDDMNGSLLGCELHEKGVESNISVDTSTTVPTPHTAAASMQSTT